MGITFGEMRAPSGKRLYAPLPHAPRYARPRLPSIQSKLKEIQAAVVAVAPGTVIRISG